MILVPPVVCLLLSVPPRLFSAVPPSTNPSSKLNKQFRYEVEKKLLGEIVEASAGRVRFKPTDATPPFDQWSSLLTSGVRSIRIVVLEKNGLQATYGEQQITDLVYTEGILSNEAWTVLTYPLPSQLAFRVRVRKYAACACTHLSATRLSNVITTKLTEELGWICAKKADFELHILLDGSRLTVEIPILIRPHTAEELPKPGFKRVESFALTKTAQIQPGDTVLDPMCGCGTFLIEAATMWPHDGNATYLGVDSSRAQLLHAQANVDAARVKVQLSQGDARCMDISSSSIDKIVSCPPFGRQFGSPDEIPDLYDNLLKEWSRVLKRDGRMVLLVDTANVENMVGAVAKSGCHVGRMRDYFRLGKIQATIMIIEKGPTTSAPVRIGRFDWEVGPQKDRALWATLRSGALPALIPFSSIMRIQTIRPR